MTHHVDADTPRRRRGRLATTRLRGLARPGTAGAALAVAALALGACGSSTPTSATTSTSSGSATTGAAASAGTAAANATVKTASSAQFGTILVNSAGMALYTYGPNGGGTINKCTGACLQAWPALTVPAGTSPTLSSGVAGTVATSTQADGTLQVTYNGKLLYTFLSDTSPGQVTGNGVAMFSVAKVSTAASSTAVSPTTASTAASGGGYQY